MYKNKNKTIYIAGNQSTVIDFSEAFLKQGYKIEGLLHVGPEYKEKISDYVEMSDYCDKKNISLIRPKSYNLKNKKDIDKICQLDIDVIVSVGWQRLIPEWLLNHCNIGAFGMHGSSYKLPKGRGRSPMNWSLIEGKDHFYTYLFKYDPGIDSGGIVDMQEFEINEWDTIRSLQHKNLISQVKLVLKKLPEILTGKVNYRSQPENSKATYYPKRVPRDGVIDWRDSTENIYNLIRAVAAPYPGAFTYHNGKKIMIWQAFPFDKKLDFSSENPGTILYSFFDDTFVVKTGTDSLYVTKYQADDWNSESGIKFKSIKNPSWDKLKEMYKDE